MAAPPLPYAGAAHVSRVEQLNRACVRLVEDNARAGACSVFAAVLPRLCQGMNVSHFEQLGVGPPWAVPCLRYLWNMQALADGFITSYLSMRGVASLADLEQQLVALLNSFCVPPLATFLSSAACTGPPAACSAGLGASGASPQASAALNPDEIALDDDDDADGANDANGAARPRDAHQKSSAPGGGAFPQRFVDFGVGPIAGHPLVVNFFRLPYAMWPPPTLSSSTDVLQLLLRFVTDRADRSRAASLHFPGNAMRIDFDAFEAFAAQQLEVAPRPPPPPPPGPPPPPPPPKN
jgi:hypothetical protein